MWEMRNIPGAEVPGPEQQVLLPQVSARDMECQGQLQRLQVADEVVVGQLGCLYEVPIR